MSVREYVGARYVPLFVGAWSNAKTYEPLSVVTYQGASYTSRQYVPTGIAIDNEQYWILSANYDAQVEAYRQEVQSILPYDETPTQDSTKGVTSGGVYSAVTEVSDVVDGITPFDSKPTSGSTKGVTSGGVYDALSNHNVWLIFGDSWTTYAGKGTEHYYYSDWAVQLTDNFSNVYDFGQYGYTIEQCTTVEIPSAIASTDFDSYDVTKILLVAGLNDDGGIYQTPSDFLTKVNAFANAARAAFPNADVEWWMNCRSPASDNMARTFLTAQVFYQAVDKKFSYVNLSDFLNMPVMFANDSNTGTISGFNLGAGHISEFANPLLYNLALNFFTGSKASPILANGNFTPDYKIYIRNNNYDTFAIAGTETTCSYVITPEESYVKYTLNSSSTWANFTGLASSSTQQMINALACFYVLGTDAPNLIMPAAFGLAPWFGSDSGSWMWASAFMTPGSVTAYNTDYMQIARAPMFKWGTTADALHFVLEVKARHQVYVN